MTGPTEIVAEREIPALLADAVDAARAAVAEFSGAETVGDYLGVDYEDSTAATHRFLAHLPGYQGWQWAVVVAGYAGAGHATISEVVLVPGPTALLAPEWVPWEQRIKPGDLGPGDLLATPADDPRLVTGHSASGDPYIDDVAAEIGLGRRRVMSGWGRADAAQRWHDGDYGPDAPMARSTKRVCRDCGFYLPLAGSLGVMFGVCGNEMSADGHVVSGRYGCGAHSDTPAPPSGNAPKYDPYDDGVLDVTVAETPPDDIPPDDIPADETPSANGPADETPASDGPADETPDEAPDETPPPDTPAD